MMGISLSAIALTILAVAFGLFVIFDEKDSDNML